MTTKKELSALKKDMKEIKKKIDRFFKAIETGEKTKDARPSKAKAVKAAKEKAPAKKWIFPKKVDTVKRKV